MKKNSDFKHKKIFFLCYNTDYFSFRAPSEWPQRGATTSQLFGKYRFFSNFFENLLSQAPHWAVKKWFGQEMRSKLCAVQYIRGRLSVRNAMTECDFCAQWNDRMENLCATNHRSLVKANARLFFYARWNRCYFEKLKLWTWWVSYQTPIKTG